MEQGQNRHCIHLQLWGAAVWVMGAHTTPPVVVGAQSGLWFLPETLQSSPECFFFVRGSNCVPYKSWMSNGRNNSGITGSFCDGCWKPSVSVHVSRVIDWDGWFTPCACLRFPPPKRNTNLMIRRTCFRFEWRPFKTEGCEWITGNQPVQSRKTRSSAFS